ncbi:ARM repeat-containing protein [Conidiobolus coronatus NRRL 28638]|uniref:ARM repeat-containing protein n=1 Tax=Conidiobolus coronatus (strain ATCC 28846 / CBS 209.66 / NRRL 28638) TaxID=796925 RepID=A0A137PET7_CONC2|nr:ARM repeat-containing protein [Conidiobolus coronatus NRRL 28638]|eukprot:KXN73482.1 ARM repeat-containing protein [Conidiobolus coronatus NRRL 28638]
MYSSLNQIKKRNQSRPNAPNRLEYFQILIDEYQSTEDKDIKYKIICHLGNFAYDPVNYNWFRQLNIIELFLDCLTEEDDEQLIELSIAGLCNLSADSINQEIIIEEGGIQLILNLLNSKNFEIIQNSLLTLIFLTNEDSGNLICTSELKNYLINLEISKNPSLKNLSNLFLNKYWID